MGGSAGDSRLFGVRSRKEIGYQIVMGRPYWTSFESSSEIPLERTLLEKIKEKKKKKKKKRKDLAFLKDQGGA